ncbi:hypothetical protein INT45_010813 [Circinella minor]|uniref:Peptidase S8/S53 domain-containing protein n=1 Tax=Circinella minor TaxID=1195481 RepID=A0A8H7VCF0_9FUNG|nr:hypothetical protein INT45_010813 [Circinella minor]
MMIYSSINRELILAIATTLNDTDTTFHQHIAIFNSRPDDNCIATLNNGSLLTLDEETHFVMLSKKIQQKYPCLENDPGFMAYELDDPIYFLAQNSSNQMELNPPNWGLTRISQRELPLGKAYFYPTSAGRGVHIYILDTGVDIEQPDIAGRAEHGISTIKEGNKTSSMDYHGHGTMVSCIAAGTQYGVAKKSLIISVKVKKKKKFDYLFILLDIIIKLSC